MLARVNGMNAVSSQMIEECNNRLWLPSSVVYWDGSFEFMNKIRSNSLFWLPNLLSNVVDAVKSPNPNGC